jgi:hypothetical protein
MLLRTIIATALIVAAGSGAGLGGAVGAAASAAPGPEAWTIGPIIRGRNYSRGMPLQPRPGRSGWYIDLPRAPDSVHYVTFPHGSLAGKRRIVMRYRIEAAPGVQIRPITMPHLPSMLTLYFQRAGDNWSARGPFETYRWYATFATKSPVTAGEHVIVAPLNANWTAVQTSSARTQPAAFRDALADADQVGFVLGGGDGVGHGAYATGPARLIVTEFRVE